MAKSYLIVIATPKTEEEFKPLFETNGLSFYKKHPNCKVKIHYENKTGLSELYNSYITEAYKDNRVVFIHDDVILDDQFVLEKLDKAHEKWNVVGLAGAKNFKFQKPAMWHLMADLEDGVNHLTGFVAHRLNDGRLITNFYGVGNQRVALIDGLFMSIDVETLLEKNARFDNRFNFHFYDIAFCLNCVMDGVSIGVGEPIFVTHLSMGQPDNNFFLLQELFLREYFPKWDRFRKMRLQA